MISDIIVGASLAFGLAFVAAWAWRPDLRAWIERPKYGFQETVRSYDRARQAAHGDRGDRSA